MKQLTLFLAVLSAAAFASVAEPPPRQTYVGLVKACEKVAVTARITGTIWRQNFTEGATVENGDVLFEIEDVVYRANLEAAEAARDEYAAQFAFAEKEVVRYRQCLARKSVSQSDYDRAVQTRDTLAARLRAAKAKVALAANDLAYTKVLSPVDGVIGEAKIHCGNNVSPDSGTLVEIVRIDPIRIQVALSERTFFRLFPGGCLKRGVTFTLERADGTVLKRSVAVDFIDNQVDARTDTVMVQLSTSNADRALIPGGYVKVVCHEQ